jgi:malate dehydrogenase (oxaloacetate-decarboxylating)(NADP+)
MKLACVREIAALAKAEISDEVAAAYAGQELAFGPEYIIPKPFDSRLILRIAPAVCEYAESAAWPRGHQDFDAYRQSLTRFRHQTGSDHAARVSGGLGQRGRGSFAEAKTMRAARRATRVEDGLANRS